MTDNIVYCETEYICTNACNLPTIQCNITWYKTGIVSTSGQAGIGLSQVDMQIGAGHIVCTPLGGENKPAAWLVDSTWGVIYLVIASRRLARVRIKQPINQHKKHITRMITWSNVIAMHIGEVLMCGDAVSCSDLLFDLFACIKEICFDAKQISSCAACTSTL